MDFLNLDNLLKVYGQQPVNGCRFVCEPAACEGKKKKCCKKYKTGKRCKSCPKR